MLIMIVTIAIAVISGNNRDSNLILDQFNNKVHEKLVL